MSEPAGRKWNLTARLMMPHEQTHEQNRVAIVNSVITKIFNPCTYWMIKFQPFHFSFSAFIVYSQFLLFDFCSFSALFNSVLFWQSCVRLCSVHPVTKNMSPGKWITTPLVMSYHPCVLILCIPLANRCCVWKLTVQHKKLTKHEPSKLNYCTFAMS